jgi:hypothetical protein
MDPRQQTIEHSCAGRGLYVHSVVKICKQFQWLGLRNNRGYKSTRRIQIRTLYSIPRRSERCNVSNKTGIVILRQNNNKMEKIT